MLTRSIGPAGTRATQDAQERPDPDPARREPVGEGEEGRGAGGRLVGEEGGVREAGPIIDGDVQILRAAAPAPASVVPVNGVAHPAEAPQLLDVLRSLLGGRDDNSSSSGRDAVRASVAQSVSR
jgi:hypothetical protein